MKKGKQPKPSKSGEWLTHAVDRHNLSIDEVANACEYKIEDVDCYLEYPPAVPWIQSSNLLLAIITLVNLRAAS